MAATIRMLPDGRGVVRFDDEPDLDGKRRQRQVTLPGPEAQELWKSLNQQAAAAASQVILTGVAASKQRLLTASFEIMGTAWIDTVENTETRNQYRGRLSNHVFPYVGSMAYQDFGLFEMQELQKIWQTNGVANSYARLLFTNIKTMFNWARKIRLIPVNPFEDIDNPKKIKKEKPDAWSDEWVDGVIRTFPEHVSIFPDIGADCGLRQGEIFGFSPSEDIVERADGRYLVVRRQIKLVSNVLCYAPPKGKEPEEKPREVPLNDVTYSKIKAFQEVYPPKPVTLMYDTGTRLPQTPQTHDLLLVTREGKAWNKNYFNPFIWKPTLSGLGIPYKGPDGKPRREFGSHALRHYFACVFLRDGGDIQLLSKYLGHHSVSFTMEEYGRFQPAQTLSAAEVMGRNAARRQRNALSFPGDS